MAENRCFLAPFKDLHLEKTPVHCEAAPCGDAVTLTLTADRYVWLCHLPHDEGVFFDNNDFDHRARHARPRDGFRSGGKGLQIPLPDDERLLAKRLSAAL